MDAHPNRAPRLASIGPALEAAGLDALVCTRNLNVLLLTGFWPVTGASLAIATRAPELLLVVPEDAVELARHGWADEVHIYKAASLDQVEPAGAGLARALARVLPRHLPAAARIGIEAGIDHLPAAYVSQQVLTSGLGALLHHALPHATLLPADDSIKRLRVRATSWERARIGTACRIAQAAFEAGVAALAPGVAERAAVLPFEHALGRAALDEPDVTRADGRFFCMSGPNAAKASAAFQQSHRRELRQGETILIHCNSYADGYWTDITRTYVLGQCPARLAGLQQAIADARAAALDAIRPGTAARAVDHAARSVLAQAGHGAAFRHPLGHGVGFTAIDHDAWPRLHPKSDDVLEEGMVFNIEPGLYFDGDCGLRDCNMVAVTERGAELLTPFQVEPEAWRRALPPH